jgi:hypothetical protein
MLFRFFRALRRFFATVTGIDGSGWLGNDRLRVGGEGGVGYSY